MTEVTARFNGFPALQITLRLVPRETLNFVSLENKINCLEPLRPVIKRLMFSTTPVFSLNFSSAGKGPFMAGKAKNMCQRRTFLGGGGKVE